MEVAELIITQFKLHLQIHDSKITNRQLAVILQRDKLINYHTHIYHVHVYNFGEVRVDSKFCFRSILEPFSKCCRLLTLIRHKKAWDGETGP